MRKWQTRTGQLQMIHHTVSGQYARNEIGYNEHGPTSHLAWKLATLAKHAMAIKSKNIWETWNTIIGLETII